MYPQASAQQCADSYGSVTYLTYSADEFTYLTYELRILRMDNVYAEDAYVYIHPQQNEIFKIPAADLRMSADPAD